MISLLPQRNHRDWFGTFLQGQYDTEKFNLYGMGGISTIDYTYQDHFSVEKEVVEGSIDYNLSS